MATKKFRAPVVVRIAGLAGLVDSALIEPMQHASDFLFDDRPGNDSLIWVDAMRCCGDDGAADDASAVFLAALKGAGISYDRTLEIY